ncbi:penicillin-binding protein 2, partial [Candidatus Uhrbacteria bacterium]|nr:penicillin-binding protein 2 [Candidatus Uhrbacteria bacterium]
QAFIEERLQSIARVSGIRNASVVVMDPRDGAVRALVSFPGYDNGIFGRRVEREQYERLLNDPSHPLFNRVVSGQFPSGSTIKPIMAAAALSEGIIDENTSFVSTGGLRIGAFFFPDWKVGGHGVTNVRKAIAESVNTFFYTIGGGWHEFAGLGLERMMDYARAFGLGSQTQIDVPAEQSGFLPSAAWKLEVKGEPWYVGDTYHVAIGQGDILVTPIQMAMVTAVFANGGTLYTPQIVDHYTVGERTHDIPPRELRERPVSQEVIRVVREGLREAVTRGSARRLASLPVAVAGKTGTAQWHTERKPHAWFTGFAPFENPEVVVTILVEEGGEGSAVAVPLAHDILSWWFSR